MCLGAMLGAVGPLGIQKTMIERGQNEYGKHIMPRVVLDSSNYLSSLASP